MCPWDLSSHTPTCRLQHLEVFQTGLGPHARQVESYWNVPTSLLQQYIKRVIYYDAFALSLLATPLGCDRMDIYPRRVTNLDSELSLGSACEWLTRLAVPSFE